MDNFQVTQGSGTTIAAHDNGTALEQQVQIVNTPAVTVSNLPATQPISAASLPLPSGAATDSSVTALLTNTQLRATPVAISGTVTSTPSGTQNVAVTSTVTTPVTGTFFQSTQPVSATSLPLPTGATTDAVATNGTQKTQVVDGSGHILAVSPNGSIATQPYPVAIVSALTTTFKITGLASTNHNLFTLENPVGSGRTVALLRLTMQAEQTALSTAVVQVCSGRTTALPTGGTVLAQETLEGTGTPVGIARCATASDGGVATAITATLSKRIWTQFKQRLITAAGYITSPDNTMLPENIQTRPFLLAPGTAVVVQVVQAAAITDGWIINCFWTEY